MRLCFAKSSNLNELGSFDQVFGCSVLHFELGGWPRQFFHVPVVVILQIPLLFSLLVSQLILVHEEAVREGQVRDLVLVFDYFIRFFQLGLLVAHAIQLPVNRPVYRLRRESFLRVKAGLDQVFAVSLVRPHNLLAPELFKQVLSFLTRVLPSKLDAL